MVDVTVKPSTHRLSTAEGWIRMSRSTVRRIREGNTPKGSVLQVGELAGIMGGKRTADLVPLCHVLPQVSLGVELEVDEDLPGVRARAVARVAGSTGVEMEALTAVSVALLTVYDMAKGLDRGMQIGGIRLLRKEGGRSGTWVREESGRTDVPGPGDGLRGAD